MSASARRVPAAIAVLAIRTFAARPVDYLVAPPTNWIYGKLLESRGRFERRLFPGVFSDGEASATLYVLR
jgi:hypothetical protein